MQAARAPLSGRMTMPPPLAASGPAALVLLSGGQDSATCLAVALDQFVRVETVGFDYGQRHSVELAARIDVRNWFARHPKWGPRLGPDHTLRVPALTEIGVTAMTAPIDFATGTDGLPNTFVPGRNLVFLVLAAALASRIGASTIFGGMCGTDAAGYPDCRADTIAAQAHAIALGMPGQLRIETPLMFLTKADTWALAHSLGGDDLVAMIETQTHTCYRGDRTVRHAWGFGCGTCPACVERARGHASWVSRP